MILIPGSWRRWLRDKPDATGDPRRATHVKLHSTYTMILGPGAWWGRSLFGASVGIAGWYFLRSLSTF